MSQYLTRFTGAGSVCLLALSALNHVAAPSLLNVVFVVFAMAGVSVALYREVA